METVKVNTSQHVAIDYPVAGLGERIAASLIDFLLFVVVFLIFAVFFSLTGLLDGNGPLTFIPIIIYAVGYVFYDLLCEIFMNGQSIGKRWLKIKVVSLDGSQPTIGQYFIRWLFRIVDMVLTQWILAIICVAVTENKQRVGDIVAGTTLIKTQPHTQLHHIAFHPVEENYQVVFGHVNQLSDRDIELIHEVLTTYYKTLNSSLIYHMAARVANLLSVSIPKELNELEFLRTVIADYNHVTSQAV